MLIGYGFVASVLPVWLLLAPRDYLSTFLKIGTILSLALGIFFVWPELKMPAISRFVDGTGRSSPGACFPPLHHHRLRRRVGISRAGVVRHHAEDDRRRDADSLHRLWRDADGVFVAIMALVAACVLEPGVYFAMNSAPALIGSTPEAVANVVSGWGFAITPQALNDIAAQVGEKTILSRSGAADARRRNGANSGVGHCGSSAIPSGTTSRSCSRRCSS